MLLVGAGDEAELFIRATMGHDAEYRPVGLISEAGSRVGRFPGAAGLVPLGQPCGQALAIGVPDLVAGLCRSPFRLLLLLAALIIRVPSEENTRRIVRGVQEIIWDTPERIAFQRIGRPLARGPVMSFLLNLTYALAFVITFGLLIWGLQLISFNWLSGTIFIFFLSIISFFALRVREAARELVVVRERENGFTVLVDFLSMPVLRLGRRIALIAPSFNVFLFILDFIIEAPFKTVLEIIEDWLSFVREKKEEIL